MVLEVSQIEVYNDEPGLHEPRFETPVEIVEKLNE